MFWDVFLTPKFFIKWKFRELSILIICINHVLIHGYQYSVHIIQTNQILWCKICQILKFFPDLARHTERALYNIHLWPGGGEFPCPCLPCHHDYRVWPRPHTYCIVETGPHSIPQLFADLQLFFGVYQLFFLMVSYYCSEIMINIKQSVLT